MIQPRYPIYIPSKGRADTAHTMRFLIADSTPFRVVVEPQEAEAYARVVGDNRILELPFSNLGLGSIPARNWIKHHATQEGHDRHWQLDDNIRHVMRLYKKERLTCNSSPALACCEDFTDRYTNVALSGLNYAMFLPPGVNPPPFYLNTRVYSATLINNHIPHQWRGRYNEDTDLCLQVLADDWCTILFNAFCVQKIRTMLVKGGNSSDLYQGDGRLKMARSLERDWPGVVTTNRRFQRPQHVIKDSWRKFDTPLIPRTDWKPAADPEYGMKLEAVGPVQSPRLKAMLDA